MKPRGAHILENSDSTPLSQSLAEMLRGASSVKLAVGYLFVEGLVPLLPMLRKLDGTSLLIGNVVNRQPEERIRAEQAARPSADVRGEEESFATRVRHTRDRTAALTALSIRQTITALPRTSRMNSALIQISTLIADGRMHVRLHTGGRQHAKVALVSYPNTDTRAPGVAIVGSTNLTLPVEKADYDANCDLDILLDGAEIFDEINGWYETYWSAAQDFQKELFEELARRWPLEANQP